MPYTNATLGMNVKIFEKQAETGLCLFGTCRGTPPTTASQFAPGAIMIDDASGTTYVNNGTTAVPGWTSDTGAGTTKTITAETNGTTAVAVFPSGAPSALTITGVYLVSLDTTAGNITVENPASTVVVTIAKGTTAGVVVGGTSLANTSVLAGEVVVVDSSSAGNARVYISYTLA